MIDEKEKELSVVANAIGFGFYSEQRETAETDGVETVYTSPEETELCRRVAERALSQLNEYRRQHVVPRVTVTDRVSDLGWS